MKVRGEKWIGMLCSLSYDFRFLQFNEGGESPPHGAQVIFGGVGKVLFCWARAGTGFLGAGAAQPVRLAMSMRPTMLHIHLTKFFFAISSGFAEPRRKSSTEVALA